MSVRLPEKIDDPADAMNAADYVDALLRSDSERITVAQEKFRGRRMRDRYRDEIAVPKPVEPQA